MSDQILTSTHKNLPSFALKYRNLDALNSLGCDMANATAKEVGEITTRMLRVDSVYTDFYIKPNNSKNEIANFSRSLNQLESLGIDISRLDRSAFIWQKYYLDPIRGPVSSGHIQGVETYLQAGFKPEQSTFESALIQVYQVDVKKGRVVTSSTGTKILDILKQNASFERPNPTNVLNLLYNYEGSDTLIAAFYNDKNYFYSFTTALLDLLHKEGADFNGQDDFGRNAIELINNATESNMLSKREGEALVQMLHSYGTNP